MFSTEDFRIDDVSDLLHFLPIIIFIGLCTPYIIAAYTLGFFLDTFRLLD